MKGGYFMNVKTHQTALFLTYVYIICLMNGCVSRESLVTDEVTRSGKNWRETQSAQEYRGPKGKHIKGKQTFYERIKCVGKNGKVIHACNADECLDRGGRVIEEVETTEKVITP
jgi:hypothetical protein